MIEDRDTYTGGHSERVATYSKDIAEEMGMSKEECQLIYQAGILHDIGKIITPDSILLKPGKLTEQEYSLIKEHVNAGYKILSQVPMYHELAKIVHAHHEHYDGSGYPKGIKGEEIPLGARIMTIADTFDAMTTSRIYKTKKTAADAIQELKGLSGTWYDPLFLKSAIKVLEKINIDEVVRQEPHSYIDEERFAYFYKDTLTSAYNQYYLDFILQKNADEKSFSCLNILYLRNFSHYNHQYGWNAGDIFLQNFAAYLQKEFSDFRIFRIFGDDFVLLHQTHQAVDIKKINNLELFKETGIHCELKHYDLKDNNVNHYKELQERV
jgi:putative nucleotidyltransferase with HDIG domain